MTEADVAEQQEQREAKFSHSRNDLHWSLYDMVDGFVRWSGYDDDNWWRNVSETDQFRVRTGKVSARVYRLNPATGSVTITDPVLA